MRRLPADPHPHRTGTRPDRRHGRSPFNRLPLVVLALALALALSACPSAREPVEPGEIDREPAAAENDEVWVRVVSEVTAVLNVFAETDGQSLRLGTVTPHGDETFQLSDIVLVGLGELRFRAEPIGQPGRFISDRVHPRPGDLIIWRVFGPPRR